MAKDYSKQEIINYGQKLFEKVKNNTKAYFRQRPLLPGYGSINSDFYSYNINLTFNINKIIEARDLDKDLNIELEVTEMVVNEMMISLLFNAYRFMDSFDMNFEVKSLSSIINLAKYYKKPYLIFSPFKINEIKELPEFKYSDHSFLVGKDEIYKVGEIENIDIYINPIEHNIQRIIFLFDNFIEYGITEDTYMIKFRDTNEGIFVDCSFYDICYKINPDVNFKIFNLK